MPKRQDDDVVTWDYTDKEVAQALFSLPVWPHFASVLNAPRRSDYPPVLLLAVLCLARVYRSQRASRTALAKGDIWADLCARMQVFIGDQPLPTRPPSARVMDGFVEWLLTADEGRLPGRLSEMFTSTSLGLARVLGQFPDGVMPDFANPDPRFVVFGDGTYVRPYSDVVEVVTVHPDGTETVKYQGSRATTGKPRTQTVLTDGTADEKADLRGVNHVTVSTWTRWGTLALAVEQAMGAEIHAARTALERLYANLGRLIHVVVWDGALVGVDVEALMTRYGVLVVNKNRARIETSQPHLRLLTAEEATAIFDAGRALPLGTSVYRTRKGHDVVDSVVAHYGQPGSVDCPHDLWVDDGALWDVREHGTARHKYKIARAVALSATRVEGREGWELDTTWLLPCALAPHGHIFTTLARPQSIRAGRNQAERKRALGLLRPVARLDHATFGPTYGLRNITESLNSWFKKLLGTCGKGGRAMRQSVNAQALDHLCAMVVLNSVTFERYRRKQR